MKRKYIMFGLLLLASACLALVSYWRAIKIDTPEEKLAYSVRQSENAFQQYLNADYRSAKATILTNIELLDRFSSESADTVRNPFAADAMIWYVRLSKLEGKNKYMDEKANCMEEAISRCKKGFNSDCSEEYLQQLIERMDTRTSNQR